MRTGNVFLVRFDPVEGYLALGGLEMQLAGAYELVEFPLEAHLSHKLPTRLKRRLLGNWNIHVPGKSSRAKFWLIGAKGYESN